MLSLKPTFVFSFFFIYFFNFVLICFVDYSLVFFQCYGGTMTPSLRLTWPSFDSYLPPYLIKILHLIVSLIQRRLFFFPSLFFVFSFLLFYFSFFLFFFLSRIGSSVWVFNGYVSSIRISGLTTSCYSPMINYCLPSKTPENENTNKKPRKRIKTTKKTPKNTQKTQKTPKKNPKNKNKTTKQQNNKTTKQQNNKTTKQQNNKTTKQQNT